MCPVFVGRDAELRRLSDLLATSDSATTPVVLLDGPLGIGKTALARQFVAGVGPAHALLSNGARVTQLLSGPPLDGRNRILMIDDVSRPTALAVHLLRTVLDRPLPCWRGLVLAHRPGADLSAVVEIAVRVGSPISRITLGPLGASACQELVSSRTPGVRNRLAQLSAGNPLFLQLLAELDDPTIDLAATDGLFPLDLSAAGPWGLDDILGSELDRLPPGRQQLLTSLAVNGPMKAGDLTADDLEELLERGLVEVDTRMNGTARLAHPMIGLAAYRQSPRHLRDPLHRAAANSAADPLTRAEHLHRLGSPSPGELADLVAIAQLVLDNEPGRALRWLTPHLDLPDVQRDVIAAHAQIAVGHTIEAEALLAPLLTADPTPDVVRMVMYCRRMTGRLDEARDLILTAAHAPDPALRIEVATLLAMIDDQSADLSTANWLTDDMGRPALAAAHWLTALLRLKEGQAVSARQHFDLAMTGAGRLTGGELATILEATAAGGWAAFCLEAYAPAAALLERAIRAAERLGHTHAIAHLCTVRAFHLVQLGRLTEADEHAQRALADTGHFGWPDTERMALGALLHSAIWQGDRTLIEARWRNLKGAGLPTAGIWRRSMESLLSKIGFQLGTVDTLLPVDEYPDAMLSIRHIDAGYIALARDELHHANDCAVAALEHSVGEIQTAQALLLQSQVACRIGDPHQAIGLADRALVIFGQHPVPLHRRLAESRLAEYRSLKAAVGLTPREGQIARLVMVGRSNREIAQELVISPRTVEDHVAKILRKRGLRSRAALAHDLSSRTGA